ncbi:hypothetical protein [Tengunoibacter tsumagoiensis]|uniref:Uncharacterized protein n=1 Tax=Tengunoibacter tsumagoiensis TaxID=2014871 RepID=A0A401ZWQ7_9CHLR|nr:hypothetical protein [Tengunoibacter tsumagoiensis]GCE11349.1 hypothetical protein KTT_12080 [Tengunoibacter tsumagoiensis]
MGETDGPSQVHYSGYTGAPEYAQPYQDPTYGRQKAGYDDAFMDDLAARIAQRTSQSSGGKIFAEPRRKSSPEPGQRLALGIVSVVMLVPLSAIILAGFHEAGGIGSLIAFGMACLAIFLINGVFNGTFD